MGLAVAKSADLRHSQTLDGELYVYDSQVFSKYARLGLQRVCFGEWWMVTVAILSWSCSAKS